MSESQLSSLILCALTLSLSLSPHARQPRPAHTKPGSSPLPPRPPPSSATPSMRGNKKSTRSKHQFCEMSECDQGAYLIRGACSHRHRLVLLVAHPNKNISLIMVHGASCGQDDSAGGYLAMAARDSLRGRGARSSSVGSYRGEALLDSPSIL